MIISSLLQTKTGQYVPIALNDTIKILEMPTWCSKVSALPLQPHFPLNYFNRCPITCLRNLALAVNLALNNLLSLCWVNSYFRLIIPSQRSFPSPSHWRKYQYTSHTSPFIALTTAFNFVSAFHLCLWQQMVSSCTVHKHILYAHHCTCHFLCLLSSAPDLPHAKFFANTSIQRGCSLCLGCIFSSLCHNF